MASVAGLSTIHVFGFDSPDALPLAEKCGIAFQLTNILRDVCEDAGRGRVYLPAEDLERFGVNELCTGVASDAFRRMMAFEADRARGFYRELQPLIGLVHRRSRPALRALIGIYSRLLERIVEGGFDVSRRVSLPAVEKGWIVVWAWME